jgi:sporulation protein YqfC
VKNNSSEPAGIRKIRPSGRKNLIPPEDILLQSRLDKKKKGNSVGMIVIKQNASPSHAPFTATSLSKISSKIPKMAAAAGSADFDRFISITSKEPMRAGFISSHPAHKMTQRGAHMKRRRWIERIADVTDLQGEVFPGQPVVELLGDGRVLIEGHGGVTEYGKERIRVTMSYGCLCVCGYGLELARMCGMQLIITGRIDNISLIRRD